jgi:hypothetical protein
MSKAQSLKIKYDDKYIAFIDVLGFESLVDSKSTEEIENYFSVILDEIAYSDKKNDIQSLLVSDSIILSCPNTELDFKILLKTIKDIQSQLALKNIWIRGAVTFGKIFIDPEKGIVVGPGQITAYKLEKVARYPRVIIDPIIIPKFAENRKKFFEVINNGVDLIFSLTGFDAGSPIEEDIFIKYLDAEIKNAYMPNQRNNNSVIDSLTKSLSRNLYSKSFHLEKYYWVKKYLAILVGNIEMSWMKSSKNSDGMFSPNLKKIEDI